MVHSNITPPGKYFSNKTNNVNTKSVYVRKICTTCAKSVSNVCKSRIQRTQKPYPTYAKVVSNVRKSRKHMQSRIQLTQICIQHCANGSLISTRSIVRGHATPWKRKPPTKRLCLVKIQKGNCTHNYGRLNGQGTACVTGRRWHAQTFGSNGSNQWGFELC